MTIQTWQDYASVGLLVTSKGVPLVRSPKSERNTRPFWKFPGGHGETFDKSPIATFLREFRQETGIQNVYPSDICLVRPPWWKTSRDGMDRHLYYFYAGVVTRPLTIGEVETGEEMRFADAGGLISDPELLQSHRNMLLDPLMKREIQKALGQKEVFV